MQIIPLQPVPSQLVTVNLNDQNCQIKVFQKSTGLFLDLSINDVPIISGVIGQYRNRIVRDGYLGFLGDLCFNDTQGTSDPDYTGLGDRFQLIYLEPGEVED